MPDNEKHSDRIRGSSREIDAAARELRQRDTPAEQVLWQSLRNRRPDGIRFRRQHPVGRFILDFCCPELKLVIEVDGGVHLGQGAGMPEETRSGGPLDIRCLGSVIKRYSRNWRPFSTAFGTSPARDDG